MFCFILNNTTYELQFSFRDIIDMKANCDFKYSLAAMTGPVISLEIFSEYSFLNFC